MRNHNNLFWVRVFFGRFDQIVIKIYLTSFFVECAFSFLRGGRGGRWPAISSACLSGSDPDALDM